MWLRRPSRLMLAALEVRAGVGQARFVRRACRLAARLPNGRGGPARAVGGAAGARLWPRDGGRGAASTAEERRCKALAATRGGGGVIPFCEPRPRPNVPRPNVPRPNVLPPNVLPPNVPRPTVPRPTVPPPHIGGTRGRGGETARLCTTGRRDSGKQPPPADPRS